MIYYDNAATTPLDPEVLETMIEFMRTEYGNPSSKYYDQALNAQKSLKLARAQILNLINGDFDENNKLVFTSGATEANNFVLKGISHKNKRKGNHIITTKVEHKSILETCKFLEKEGFEVTYLDVDELGYINLEQLKNSIKKETLLVSIIWGNNEIGTLNDIASIGNICKEKNVLFHTDATQVVGKIDINLKKLNVDFLTMSAHKIYGPKGVGALFVGTNHLGITHRITPLLHGGSQEYKLRGGTHAMHNIVGFGKAAEVAKRDHLKYIPLILEKEKQLKSELLEKYPDLTFNGDQNNKIPGIVNITIPGITNELFIKNSSDKYAISTGSACALGEPSHVIAAIGKADRADETVRFSVGKL